MSSGMHPTLIKLDRARTAIVQAKTLCEVKEIRDQAEAMRVYAKQAKDSLEIQNHCAEIKLRAERRAGEMLASSKKLHGARGAGKKVESNDAIPLKDLGVSRDESSRWQRVASVPESKFEEHIAETIETKKELTTVSVLKLANAAKPKNGAVKTFKGETGFFRSLSDIQGKFGCIYADPPWRYSNQSTRASTGNHYDTLTVDQICKLPIADFAAPKCHLHLWTTNAFLFECPKIFEAWGFEFKSSFVWVKPQMGIGNYWRNSHEILLLAVRGGLVGQAKNLKSWKLTPRGLHSEKPSEIRKDVMALSPGPYLELFGRRPIQNWTVFGDEMLPNQEELAV